MKTMEVRICWVSGLALLFILPFLLLTSGAVSSTDAAEAKAAQYIGAESCAKLCHKSAAKGKQLPIWQESKHAKAYGTLGTPEAKAIAKAKGIADPQKADACLKCHTTAHGVSDELLGAKFSKTEGVGCESCHGAGSLYKKMATMKDREKAVAAGLVIPDEKTCLGCHNKKSPTFKSFNFEEMWKKIAHPKPEKKG